MVQIRWVVRCGPKEPGRYGAYLIKVDIQDSVRILELLLLWSKALVLIFGNKGFGDTTQLDVCFQSKGAGHSCSWADADIDQ